MKSWSPSVSLLGLAGCMLVFAGAARAQDSPAPPAQEGAKAQSGSPDIEGEMQRLRAELQQYEEGMKKLGEAVAASSRKPDDILAAGSRIYRASCAACHGKEGNGKGPGAGPLFPKPRDFTNANFKWRSTPSGSVPLDADLLRTVSEGVRGTAMPSWKKLLTREERWAVVQYVKRFSPRFLDEEPDPPLPISPESPAGADSIARGKQVFQASKCWECHGQSGKGDGPASPTLKDDKGQPIQAFDFTSGQFRCGSANADIYKTFTTGLSGTPMPGYADVLPDEKRWDLVHYVRSLAHERGLLDYIFRRPVAPW